MDGPLSAEQIERYHETGYLVVEEAFDAEEVAEMRAECDWLLELGVNAALATGRESGRATLTSAADTEDWMVRMFKPVNDLSLVFAEAMADERIEGAIRQLVDDDPALIEEKLNYKQPILPVEGLAVREDDDGFPVHNDWTYYREQGYPRSTLSTALLVDDFTVENGPLHVWPGTHTDHIEHEPTPAEGAGRRVPPGEVDYDGGRDLLAPAGSVVFFNSLLVHGSSANTSGGPRRLMIWSHYPESEGEGLYAGERMAPKRLRESPHEWVYQRMKDRGEYTDRFEAP
jgi:ectoine hydroxylase-related dioxygenase (phytanoyl-CoA dioxygenase family)